MCAQVLYYPNNAVAQQSESSGGEHPYSGFLTYEYLDYGVKIDYPESWHIEAFAFDDRYFSRPHPGHLPGLPLQLFQPTELDMQPQNLEIAVVGLYPAFDEFEGATDTKFLVKVRKVGFWQSLEAHVKTYVAVNIVGMNSVSADSPAATIYEVVEQRKTTLSQNDAIALVSEKKWGWNDELGDYEYAQRYLRIFTVEDDRIYILQYDAPLEEYDKYLPLAEETAAKFEITSTGLQKTLWALAIAITIAGISGYLVVKAKRKKGSLTSLFVANMRRLLPAALGIEILCITAAEIGGNVGLYLFGYRPLGIAFSYALVYLMAGFTTFAAIVGRYSFSSATITTVPVTEGGRKDKVFDNESTAVASCDCCSVLEHDPNLSFFSSLKYTLSSFARGVRRLPHLRDDRNSKQILRTSLILLFTAESGCILTAATVDFVLYQYSLFIAIPISFAAGTMAVAAPHALRLAKRSLQSKNTSTAGRHATLVNPSSALIGITDLGKEKSEE